MVGTKMETKGQWALRYARAGWRVFPLHHIENGKCSCGGKNCQSPGKHPLTSDGLLSGSVEEELVARWWQLWPEANIGVRTGAESGLVVIDLDDIELRRELERMGLPDTVNSTTGSGGKHYFFRHPGVKVKSVTKVLPGIDSRGDGGYVVVPPSNHWSGNLYEWNDGPGEIELAECPAWWLEAIEERKRDSEKPVVYEGQRVLQGNRNNTLFDWGCQAWKRMPIGESVLVALLTAQNDLMCDPPLPEHEVKAIAESIARYDGKTQEQYEAEIHGKALWEGLQKGRQEEIARMLKAHTTREAGPMPEFMPEGGLIREIADYILSQSERPIPELAVCAAACFVGVLAGRKFETESGLGPNILLVGLAESGSGKEKARKLIGNMAQAIGATDLMGADDIASAPGLVAEMAANPVKLLMLDEFGHALKSITDAKAAGSKREIMATIMKFYSLYGGVYHGTAYADQKARPKTVIENPCMVIYATSTHKPFYDALSVDHGSDGFISRLLVVPSGEERPKLRRPVYSGMPGLLKARLVELWGLIPSGGMMTVPMTDEVEQAFFDLDESMTELMTTPQARSVYARVKENAIKLALVYAVAQDFVAPLIDHKAFVWGRDIALWCANHITEKLETTVAENETDRMHKRMAQIVRESGLAGMQRREIQRRFLNMKKYERDETLATLFEIGDLFEMDGRIYHGSFYREVKGEE